MVLHPCAQYAIVLHNDVFEGEAFQRIDQQVDGVFLLVEDLHDFAGNADAVQIVRAVGFFPILDQHQADSATGSVHRLADGRCTLRAVDRQRQDDAGKGRPRSQGNQRQ